MQGINILQSTERIMYIMNVRQPNIVYRSVEAPVERVREP
jgi:hypothetical protein